MRQNGVESLLNISVTLKVIFFVTNLDSGGLENYLLRFLTTYAHRFEQVILFCKGGKGGVLESDFLRIPNLIVEKQKIGNIHPHHYVKLKNWLRNHRNAVICDFTGNFAGPVLWASKTAGINKRLTFYRSSTNRFKEDRIRLFVNKIYNSLVARYASSVLANSEYAFEFFFTKKQLDSRFKVIYNGIDFERFLSIKDNLRKELGIKKDVFVVGHTGRFNPAKNHNTILSVACHIMRSRTDVVFILCGKGVKENLQPVLDNDEKYKRYRDSIFLFENRSDISRFLNTCDAYIFPSVTEGQPNSLIEAWSKGLPFVASNIKPIKQITKPEFHNFLESPYDIIRFSEHLINFVNGGFTDVERNELQRWTRETFDSRRRFDEFYRELTS